MAFAGTCLRHPKRMEGEVQHPRRVWTGLFWGEMRILHGVETEIYASKCVLTVAVGQSNDSSLKFRSR